MSLYHAINLRYTDPIGTMFLNDKYLVLGSVLGRISFCDITNKNTKIWADLSSENITGIVSENQRPDNDVFFIAIGDDEVQKLRVINFNKTLLIDFITKFSNYDSQREHSDMCNSCFTIMSQNSLILSYLVEPNQDVLVYEKVKTTLKVSFFM